MKKPVPNPSIEELYLTHKKRSTILLVAVIFLIISTAGSLIWGFSENNAKNSAKPSNISTNDNPNGSRPSGGLGMRQMDFSRFFNSDGSVNTDQVKEFAQRMPSADGSLFLERIKSEIKQAVVNSKISQTQADALIKEIESETGSSSVN